MKLAGDLLRNGYAGKTIGIKLRYDNFKTVTLDRRIRLLGVRVGALSAPGAKPAMETPMLFE